MKRYYAIFENAEAEAKCIDIVDTEEEAHQSCEESDRVYFICTENQEIGSTKLA